MKKKVLILCVFLYSIFSVGKFLYNYVKKDPHKDNEISIKDSSIYMLNQYGIIKNDLWVHEKDSLAEIKIKFKKLMFQYGGKFEEEDIYDYQIKNELAKDAKTKLQKEKFLILTNDIDTLVYEILTYNDSIMSLKNFPKGDIQVFKKNVLSN